MRREASSFPPSPDLRQQEPLGSVTTGWFRAAGSRKARRTGPAERQPVAAEALPRFPSWVVCGEHSQPPPPTSKPSATPQHGSRCPAPGLRLSPPATLPSSHRGPTQCLPTLADKRPSPCSAPNSPPAAPKPKPPADTNGASGTEIFQEPFAV